MKLFRYFAIVPLVIAGLFAGAPPAQAAKEEGRFHLIYLVTVPNLDKKAAIEGKRKEDYDPVTAAALAVGAEVDIEPGILTDGVRVVFAFDYCRRHYPEKNGDVRRQHEEQVAREKVAPEDRADLERYCKMEEFSLKGEQFTVMDNAGVHLTLREMSFKPGTLHELSGMLSSPEFFTAKITRIEGAPPEKLPLAQEARQPYVFLMSRNRSLLERAVPVARPTQEEKKSLLARLERYKEKRQKEDPKGEKEKCDVYLPEWQGRVHGEQIWWRGLPDESPATGEVLYNDLNGDGHVDMLARLIEVDAQIMFRSYSGNGNERCALRAWDGNLNPLFRPISILRTRDCIFVYSKRYHLATNPLQHIVAVQGPPEACRNHDVIRLYEKN